MLKALSLLFLSIALVVGGREWLQREAVPCEKPILYFVGSFDRRFDLSQAAFLSALTKAEGVWESASGRDLFVYSAENGELPINLIYDYRQEVTEELSQIETVVKTGESSYDALESEYRTLKAQYSERKRSYDAAVSAFNQESAAYEESVERWNSGKRSSKSEFEALEAGRLALEAELSQLKSQEAALNTLVKEINQTVGELNTLAKKLNLNVEAYNTVGASRGDTFAGGIYTADAKGERIDIFEFENQDKLVRVLAHELGHALGLEHVDDPKAIMYYLNESEAGKLTEADLNALTALCGVQ
ncbi:MAG: matrixin family metalloprotease [Patescibacteria group bacterium]